MAETKTGSASPADRVEADITAWRELSEWRVWSRWLRPPAPQDRESDEPAPGWWQA